MRAQPSSETIRNHPQDARIQAILMAAFHCFSSYGYRRTSMQDIARAAGVSRPALYQYFNGKEAIFSALTADYFNRAVAGMEVALQSAGNPAQQLLAAMEAKDAGMIEALLTSAHGAELLDIKTSASAGLVADGEARMQAVFVRWILDGEAGGHLSFARMPGSPEGFARTLLLALIGLKTGFTGMEAYREGQHQLAQSFGQMLTPRG